MKAFAPSALVGVVGAAVLSGSILQGSPPLAGGQATAQAVRDRVPAATPYVLDRSTNRVFVRTAPDELSIQNRDGTSVAVLYRGPANGQIRWVSPSPAGGLVAVEELLLEDDRRGKRRVQLVDDRGGAVQHTIPDVVEFVWSPDGQSAAYTTGTYERFERPTSTGVWTLSISSGTPQRVNVDGDYLFWARFDGALYIWDWRPDERKMVVLRYDPVSRALMETRHRSIYFSPSGRYYHNYGGAYMGPFDVFVTADDRSLKASSPLLRGLTSMRAPLGWAPESDLLLIPVVDTYFAESGLLYDPSTDTGRFVAGTGRLMGWSTEAGELAYWQDGRVVTRRIADAVVK